MENKYFNDFVNGYRHVVSEINNLDVEDKTSQIADIEADIEQNELKIQKGNVYRQSNLKVFEEYSKEYIENIKNDQQKIEELKKFNEEVLAGNIKRKEELEKYRQNIRNNVKAQRDTLISDLESKKEKVEVQDSQELIDLKKQSADIQKQIDDKMNEHNSILQAENENPHAVKDEKYKEFLLNQVDKLKKDLSTVSTKIDSINSLMMKKINEIKESNAKIDEEIKDVNNQYKNCLMDLSRIDRGEKDSVLLDMEANIKTKHTKDEPKKDEPKKDEPKKDEPKKDEPKKDEPKTDEPKKDEPKKDEPKKDEPSSGSKIPSSEELMAAIRRAQANSSKTGSESKFKTSTENSQDNIHRLTDEEFEEILPEQPESTNFDQPEIIADVEGAKKYLEDKKRNDRLDVLNGLDYSNLVDKTNTVKRHSIDEIRCMTKLGLYAIKYEDGTIEYYEPDNNKIISSKKQENEERNNIDDGQELEKGVDFNILNIIKQEFGIGIFSEKNKRDYLNGNQFFSIIYDDSMDYKTYKKMLQNSTENAIDIDSQLPKLSFKERRYFKNLAKDARKSGLGVYCMLDTRNIIEKIKDRFTRKQKALPPHEADKRRYENYNQALLKRKREYENPNVLDSQKDINIAQDSITFSTDSEKDNIIYHSGVNSKIYNDAAEKAYESNKNPHKEFVEKMAAAAGEKAVDERMESVLKKINKDMGIEMPTSKNQNSKESDQER